MGVLQSPEFLSNPAPSEDPSHEDSDAGVDAAGKRGQGDHATQDSRRRCRKRSNDEDGFRSRQDRSTAQDRRRGYEERGGGRKRPIDADGRAKERTQPWNEHRVERRRSAELDSMAFEPDKTGVRRRIAGLAGGYKDRGGGRKRTIEK